MLQALDDYIKLAVDIQRGEDGSRHEDVWGADWNPTEQEVTFESLINIRPRQNNRSLEIEDETIRQRVAQIAVALLGEP